MEKAIIYEFLVLHCSLDIKNIIPTSLQPEDVSHGFTQPTGLTLFIRTPELIRSHKKMFPKLPSENSNTQKSGHEFQYDQQESNTAKDLFIHSSGRLESWEEEDTRKGYKKQ